MARPVSMGLTWRLLKEKDPRVGATRLASWLINLDYKDRSPPVGEYRLSWDTTGGTQRIFQSRATRNTYAATGFTPPSFGGAIGIRDGEPEGCEIGIPALRLTCDATIHRSYIDMEYLRTLSDMTYSVNSAAIWNFQQVSCYSLDPLARSLCHWPMIRTGDRKIICRFSFSSSHRKCDGVASRPDHRNQ